MIDGSYKMSYFVIDAIMYLISNPPAFWTVYITTWFLSVMCLTWMNVKISKWEKHHDKKEKE